MKYLFFDIECADGGRATICSFGYVIADMDFKIIKREDIIINPEGRFYLTGRAGRPDVELAYPIERFKKAPSFAHFHKRIKDLVENEDYYVVGHSIGDDVTYLNKACARYKLEPFKFSYFDTQKMYRELSGEKKQISLENALLSLGIKEKFRAHQSVEDARATMLLLKELLSRAGKSFEDYRESTDRCTGSTDGGNSQWDYVPPEREHIKFNGHDFRPDKSPNHMVRGRRNHTVFRLFLERGQMMGERSDKLLGKKVTLSMNYEADHFKEMIILAGMIKAAGGDYEIKATNCDVFATFEKIDAEGVPYHCSRTDYVQAEIENGKDIEIITFDALLALLGISREELEAMPPVDTEYLIDEKYRRVETV